MPSVSRSTNTEPLCNPDDNNPQKVHRRESRVEIVELYDPAIPPAHWQQIETFVKAAVNDCHDMPRYAARGLMGTVTRYIHWCWRDAGLPLERDVVFRKDVIADYISRGCVGLAVSSRGTYRSRLFAVSDRLASPTSRTPLIPPVGRADPLTPYSPAEVTLLRHWASGQATTYRSANATLLLCLGLGAGLSLSEMTGIRASDVLTDEDGVVLQIQTGRVRSVPVRRDWEGPLADIARSAIRPSQYVLKPTRKVEFHPNLVSDFVRKSPPPVPVTPQRMRASWIVGHLVAGVPVPTVVQAAGLETYDSLRRYLPHIPSLDSDETRRMLTRSDRERVSTAGPP